MFDVSKTSNKDLSFVGSELFAPDLLIPEGDNSKNHKDILDTIVANNAQNKRRATSSHFRKRETDKQRAEIEKLIIEYKKTKIDDL